MYFFFDLDGVIGQEIVEHIVVHLALEGLVVPGDVEREHHAVVVEVLLQALVGVAPAQFDLEILFVLPR